ncbi:TPM domain-containing protein [Enhydrobacter sp.]|jgi:putative membrane protein|uniref:TPM domain-containing protein n=1 Tax=Enhydrobacter sp. TaxID=1894999 RepID=UPI0026081F01|nr:TPM domain-containing protein [Enhydrobacter sp.]WIM12659.1 MAG: hypothetical protein OJF58_003622 [Enhydrobacter sp.]
MSFRPEDSARISAAIRAAEARTSGEIVCVLARRSVDRTALPVVIAAVVSLLLPWLLVQCTALAVRQILLLQVATFVALTMILCQPRIAVALVPRAARRAVAHRRAMEQFVLRGITRTRDRTAVLIFVSLAERYARIVADDGIAARVPQSEWQRAVDALTGHMREGRIADGFVAAIDKCADVLAMHFPPTESSRDELPDRIYLI